MSLLYVTLSLSKVRPAGHLIRPEGRYYHADPGNEQRAKSPELSTVIPVIQHISSPIIYKIQ